MNNNIYKKITYLLLVVLFAFSACTKDNSIMVIEEVEDLELGFKATVNGEEFETDAVVSYCQNDSIEFYIVSNKEVLLDFPLLIQEFEIGDFVYLKSISIDPDSSWTLGSHALGEETTGFPGISIWFSEADISIDSSDGALVSGVSEGNLEGIDPFGNPVSFSYDFNFSALVVQQSNYCE